MTARLVTRHWAADEEMAKGTKPLVLVPVVTDSDAARLEAVVAEADEMRGVLLCSIASYTAPYKTCCCRQCRIARAYDAKRGEVGVKP